MARKVTLGQLEDQIRWLGDQERATLRTAAEKLRVEINKSIQAYRLMVTESGGAWFLSQHSGTFTPGKGTTDDGVEVAWGMLDIHSVEPEVHLIYGLDVVVEGQPMELERVSFTQRNYFASRFGSDTGYPRAFFAYDGDRIAILPPPDSAYQYTLLYLPVAADLEESSDEFDPGISGGEQWIVLDVVQKIYSRDNYPRLIATTYSEKKDFELRLSKAHAKRVMEPGKRLDTRGRSRSKGMLFPWRKGM